MKFNNLVKINARFQYSINIGLDLNDTTKINNYIPTTSSINFLSYSLNALLTNNGNYSTLLIGPYGRGKSHAILVLLYLLSKNDYSEINELLNQIKDVDINLWKKIERIKKSQYLPVIISSTRGDLNQSLFVSLRRALEEESITNITLKSDFDDAVSRIEYWKINYPETYNQFKNFITNKKIDFEEFTNELKEYDHQSLNLFKKAHKTILSGVEFVSDNHLEVIDYYKQVTDKLVSEYGYKGIYIIFDEFSKFLESRTEDIVTNDMKIIQDIIELCNSSNGQMNVQLVLHKPINDYTHMDETIRNAFRGIEGRTNTYYFTSTLKDSFDLIANVISKNEEYFSFKEEHRQIFEDVENNIDRIPAFTLTFNESYIHESLLDVCFPLHPICAYLLVKISEQVGQNERTLFTFLAKESQNSFSKLLLLDWQKPFIWSSVIYDYFIDQLLDEQDELRIKRIASNAESALKLVDSTEDKELIKTLALIMIVNEPDLLPTNVSILSSALMIDQSLCRNLVKKLISKEIFVKRYGGQIQFKVNMQLNITKEINNIIQTKFSHINVIKELNSLYDEPFIYPTTYNRKYAITRYFKREFILEDDFLHLNTAQYFFDDFSDGCILNIIRSKDDNHSMIEKKVLELSEKRLLVVYPKRYYNFEPSLKKILGVRNLLADREFLDANHLIYTELDLYHDDLLESIKDEIVKNYDFNNDNSILFCVEKNYQEKNDNKDMQRMVSSRILDKIFEDVFTEYPVVNLELLNKNNIRGTYQKARIQVMSNLLENKEMNIEKGTSPEDTIQNCLFFETGIVNHIESKEMRSMLELLSNIFSEETGKFGDIFDQLRKPPFGMRLGVIPVYIAYVLGKLQHSIILYFEGAEIQLDATTLDLLSKNPEKYSFKIDRESADKKDYLKDLSILFHIDDEDRLPTYNELTAIIQEWFAGLPKITKQSISSNSKLDDPILKKIKRFCMKLNVNPSDFILNQLGTLGETYKDSISILEKSKLQLDGFINICIDEIKRDINNMIGFDGNDNLIASTKSWIDKNNEKIDSMVLSDSIRKFIEICNEETISEKTLVNKIAYCFTGLFIQDWSKETKEMFLERFKSVEELNTIALDDKNINKITLQIGNQTFTKVFGNDIDDSSEAELLEDMIKEQLDDFGEILSNEQKLALLMKILKKYI